MLDVCGSANASLQAFLSAIACLLHVLNELMPWKLMSTNTKSFSVQCLSLAIMNP